MRFARKPGRGGRATTAFVLTTGLVFGPGAPVVWAQTGVEGWGSTKADAAADGTAGEAVDGTTDAATDQTTGDGAHADGTDDAGSNATSDEGSDEPAPAPPPAPPPPPPPPPAPVPPPPPPPPPPQPELAVYIAVNGMTTGPFTRAELQARAVSGELTDQTMIWQDGMGDWAAAGTVEEIATLIAESQPPAPAFDAVAYVTGTWAMANPALPIEGIGQGVFNGTYTFGNDGQLAVNGTLETSLQGTPITMTLEGSGTWRAEQISDTQFVVYPTLTVTFYAPGYPPQSGPSTDPVYYTVLGPDQMRDNEGTTGTRTQ